MNILHRRQYDADMVRSAPGFLTVLSSQLAGLTAEERQRIDRRGGLRLDDIVKCVVEPVDHTVNADNPSSDCIIDYGDIATDVTHTGYAAYTSGRVAFCILCGGAGTRLGLGVTKGLVKLPKSGKSLLQLKLEATAELKNVWVMTSPENYEDVVEHVQSLPGTEHVKVFMQFESVRLTLDNQVFLDEAGRPSFYPCGHGDIAPALQESGLLQKFIDDGGKHICVVNVDNLAATPDYSIIGQHIVSSASVTCEVVARSPGDTGGVLCSTGGINQIVEMFRMSPKTDTSQFVWLNTNTFIFDADLDFSHVKWSWHRVRRQVRGKMVVQYERLIQDLTENFDTKYVAVPRDVRFKPLKTLEDLQAITQTYDTV